MPALQLSQPVKGLFLTDLDDTSVGEVDKDVPKPGFGDNDLPMPDYHNGGYTGEEGISRWRADVGQCRTKPVKKIR